MKTVIMAGGKGTRINSLFPDIPKPLVPIEGKPILEREIDRLRYWGLTDIILTVSYKAEQIKAYFGDGAKFGVNIEYYEETEPLGSAGALFKLRDRLQDDFLLINADVLFDIDFGRFIEFHKSRHALVTLLTHPNAHPYDSGLLETDESGAVTRWWTKESQRPQWYQNRVNAGIHVVSPQVLDESDVRAEDVGRTVDGERYKVDLDRQILMPLCGTGKMYCCDSTEYVKDMGTVQRYETVCRDFRNGTVQARNLQNPQRAVFLDRDGTLVKDVGFLTDIDKLELLPRAAEAVKKINESGYLAILATNQPVIARGEVTVAQLREIHNKLETLLGREGAYLDAIYYCPHHPHKGYAGEVPELKIECECRKPKPGMLLKAGETYHIDLKASWMVGDSEKDIMAGKAAGCKTALIGNQDFSQELSVDSLYDFCRTVMEREES